MDILGYQAERNTPVDILKYQTGTGTHPNRERNTPVYILGYQTGRGAHQWTYWDTRQVTTILQHPTINYGPYHYYAYWTYIRKKFSFNLWTCVQYKCP